MGSTRLALVGVGYLGRFHAQKLDQISREKMTPIGVDFLGVHDVQTESAEGLSQSLGCKNFKDLDSLRDELLKTSRSGVFITSSTQSHFQLAKYFLESGISVFVEKPVAATLDQSLELAEILNRDKSLVLGVGHIERFNPSYLFLKKHMSSCRHLELKRLAPFKTRGSDVSVLYDLLIHDLDLSLWLTGSSVKRLFVSGSKMVTSFWDTVQLSLEMDSGVHVSIEVSRTHPETRREARVVAQDFILSIQSGSHDWTMWKKNQNSVLDQDKIAVEKGKLEGLDAMLSEDLAFIRALQECRPAPVPLGEAIAVMRYLQQIETQLLSRVL